MKTINQNKQFIFNHIIILLTAYRTTFVKSHLYQQIRKHAPSNMCVLSYEILLACRFHAVKLCASVVKCVRLIKNVRNWINKLSAIYRAMGVGKRSWKSKVEKVLHVN